MKVKKMLAAGMAVTMAASFGLTGCSGGGDATNSGDSANTAAEGGDAAATSEDGIEKPEKIRIMVDGTVFTKENARDQFEARWEELTGIDLDIHDNVIAQSRDGALITECAWLTSGDVVWHMMEDAK